MIYMGSKARIAKPLLSMMLKDIEDRYFVDAFTGGGNLIQHAECKNKLASDINQYTISFLNKIQEDTSWLPKNNKEFTKEDYKYVKNHKEEFPDYFLGYVGYSLSFCGKWFGGYRKNASSRDYVAEGYRHTLKQACRIKDVEFKCISYNNLQIPANSIVYCDIPYRGTTSYGKHSDGFDYEYFYNWCRQQKHSGHDIYISEYSMPEDFKIVWEKEVKMTLDVKSNSKIAVERLYTL